MPRCRWRRRVGEAVEAEQGQTPKAGAPIDLTGYWVSVVDEDWRFRMVMPPPGDYMGVPMTAEAGKVAATWDAAKDEAAGDVCKAFGAPAILRQPGHVHISWQDDQTLQLDTRCLNRLSRLASSISETGRLQPVPRRYREIPRPTGRTQVSAR